MPILTLALSLAAFVAPAELEARVSVALGAPVGAPGGLARPIDPRLRLPACPGGPTVEAAPDGASARISCTAPHWTFVAALARDARATPAAAALMIRRGDRVRLVIAGPGFAVTRDGVAQSDAAVGASVPVRPDGAAGVLRGVVEADGAVRLSAP